MLEYCTYGCGKRPLDAWVVLSRTNVSSIKCEVGLRCSVQPTHGFQTSWLRQCSMFFAGGALLG